ncbi:TetR/AcrR family transcriptional regulator [Corynebacterium sp. H113]|uniref:TetR/AcrR family transcriptional regulator n=1 Tax=Corynebacterium sp. H113 TaxID=3133419 RepID=UPI0030A877BB
MNRPAVGLQFTLHWSYSIGVGAVVMVGKQSKSPGHSPRISKPTSVRRAEIVDAAARLFAQQGFVHTSVQNIISEVGIAKGTFYHHFSSKDEVLSAIVDKQVAIGIERAREVAARRDLDIPTKCLLVVIAQNPQGEEALILKYLDEHPEIHRASTQRSINATAPILSSVVKEGIAEGIFDVSHPDSVIELLLASLIPAVDNATEDPAITAIADPELRERKTHELMTERLNAALTIIERSLGAAPGTITEPGSAIFGITHQESPS